VSHAEDRSPAAKAGLYRPDEIFWRVNREAVLLLTGARALLLQTAHPLVAAGVADHSRFRRDPFGRLRRTLEAMLSMIYGTRAEAEAAAAAVNAAHARVRGTLRRGTRAFPAGTPYSADDPELSRWVHATLVDSAIVGFETFVRALGPDERDALIRESGRIGVLLHIPRSHAFADAAEFDAYMFEMTAGGILEIDEDAAAIAASVMHPLRRAPRFLGYSASFASMALLPPDLRVAYALRWGTSHERAWRALRATIRAARPRLPAALRLMPHARRAEAALRRGGRPADPSGKVEEDAAWARRSDWS
jgi:uncharacterized protein (DUF2236 family)